MNIQQMLEAHPWPGHVDREALAACIEECFECAKICASCSDACLSEQSVDNLRKCIRLNLDCADICETTGRVLARQTEYDANLTKPQLSACREAARICGEECSEHAEKHAHCQACAESCRRCVDSCDRLLAAMK